MSNIYEIVSPDAFLRPYIEDYDTFSRMFKILKEAYEPSIVIDKEFSRKTAKLVQEHTKIGKIKSSLDIYEIDEHTIKKLEKSKVSDTEKVFNLLRSIEKMVTEQSAKNPYLVSIGQRAEIVSMIFKQRQKDTKETLEDIKEIIEDMNVAEKERTSKKMSSEIFSVYWTLRTEGLDNSESTARDTSDMFEEYPHWRTNSEQERELRRELYKVLIKNKVLMKKAVEIGSKILNDLKRAEK